MKIKKTQLKQIVKEELEKVLEVENEYFSFPEMKEEYMELARNLYEVHGLTMPKDVEEALELLDIRDLVKSIFDVGMTVQKVKDTHRRGEDVDFMSKKLFSVDNFRRAGGIDGLFRVVLKRHENPEDPEDLVDPEDKEISQ
tara:strand:- start:14051 stop:14473 length:423 start_codon:yes stop_codon:yes gene_type:complete